MLESNKEQINKKRGLGRGLGSLLGGDGPAPATAKVETKRPENNLVEAQIPTEARIWNIQIDKLQASEFQPRREFDSAALAELSESIKQHGIIQPLLARRLDSQKFEIIAGERRWRAAQLAGLHEVPVIVKTLANQKTLEVALIENIQREDLNPIEEAEAYQRLADEFNLTQQEIAAKVGKERATVANAIRLLQLSPEVRKLLQAESISSGHAKVLLGLTDLVAQNKLAQKIVSEKLSVRALEKLVEKWKKEGSATALSAKPAEDNQITQGLIRGLSEEIQKILGTKINIDYAKGKGKISIHFYSDEELTQLIERLKEGCRK